MVSWHNRDPAKMPPAPLSSDIFVVSRTRCVATLPKVTMTLGPTSVICEFPVRSTHLKLVFFGYAILRRFAFYYVAQINTVNI